MISFLIVQNPSFQSIHQQIIAKICVYNQLFSNQTHSDLSNPIAQNWFLQSIPKILAVPLHFKHRHKQDKKKP
jgi:hypothetical protein